MVRETFDNVGEARDLAHTREIEEPSNSATEPDAPTMPKIAKEQIVSNSDLKVELNH